MYRFGTVYLLYRELCSRPHTPGGGWNPKTAVLVEHLKKLRPGGQWGTFAPFVAPAGPKLEVVFVPCRARDFFETRNGTDDEAGHSAFCSLMPFPSIPLADAACIALVKQLKVTTLPQLILIEQVRGYRDRQRSQSVGLHRSCSAGR